MLGAYMACWLLLTLLGRGCCGGGRFGSTALLCPLSSIKSTPRRSRLLEMGTGAAVGVAAQVAVWRIAGIQPSSSSLGHAR
jgi:hypothetical protein